MFAHVIVGVDGRPNGRDAIALGLQLVDHEGRISLAHVHSVSASRGGSRPGFGREERDASEAVLARERDAAQLNADLLSVGCESVGAGLHGLVEQHDGDLLVVGSCRRGHIGRVFLGDDTRATLHGAPCAVAIAPAGYRRSPRPIRTVGVAYDATPQSRVALALARSLATREHAGVRAQRVIAYPNTSYAAMAPIAPEQMDRLCEDAMQAAREELALPRDVDAEVVMGAADEELDRFSGEVDLLVVGSRDRGPLKRVMLGSTSGHLASSARCPVIIVARGAAAPAVSAHASTTSGA